MDYSTLLLEFIDGTLEHADEQALFNALSSNEELRGELKHLLAISSSVRNDEAAFIPQTASTQRIFAELGFTPPLPVPTASVSTTASHSMATAIASGSGSTASLLRRLLPTAGSAVLASLATAGIVFSVLRSPDTPSIAETPKAAVHHPFLPSRTATLERILAHHYETGGTMAQTQSEQRLQTEGTREIVRYVYVPQTPQQTTTPHEQSTLPATIGAEESAPSIAFSRPLAAHAPSSLAHGSANTMPTAQKLGGGGLFSLPWHTEDNSAFLVEISNTVSESFPNATVDPSSHSWLHNKSVTVLYPLTDNQSIGVTFGQEPFFQRFEARNSAGRRYQYEQNPVLPWAGVAYRYSLPNLGVFSPFGQFMLGGTQVGALGRTLVGFTYSPSPTVQLMAGINGSLLYYPIQSTWYSSSKLGLTYGIGISL